MKKEETNWQEAVKPLLKKYSKTPHPLIAANVYQHLVLVVLSAQTNDKLVNSIAEELFKAFPNMQSLSQATPEAMFPYISKIINFRNKAKWLTAIANEIKKDSNISISMDALVKLPGIGRKLANVIIRKAGAPAEGIMVDLHTLRVAPRLYCNRNRRPQNGTTSHPNFSTETMGYRHGAVFPWQGNLPPQARV